MITALLVDDEPRNSDRLARMLTSLEDIEVIGTARNVADARVFLQGRQPDVVFLDVSMPGGPGVELLPDVGGHTRVIFVTATEVAAIAAFEHGAIDYVLKPCSQERIERAVDRLRHSLAGPPDAAQPALTVARGLPSRPDDLEDAAEALSLDDKLPLATAGSRVVQLVAVGEIAWIAAMENYTQVRTVSGKPVTVKRKLAAWETILPGEAFRRLDRSLIINLHRLVSTQSRSREQTLLSFTDIAESLPIGRTAATRLKELLRV